jgi:hypothetical protein
MLSLTQMSNVVYTKNPLSNIHQERSPSKGWKAKKM